MKITLLIILISFCTIASATDYYLSSSGNDLSNNGISSISPWKTISKINSILLKPGDKILFNRGDTFYGTLKLSRSGISGSPITIGAYGTGQDPLITGLSLLSSWTSEGDGIYSAALTSLSKLETVILDGKQYWMGQYPNTGFLSFESYNNDISITDADLPSTPNWTGAEIFIRTTLYSTTRATVTNHSNHTLTYTQIGRANNESLSNNFGYIIQNDIRTLKDLGDWFYDGNLSKFYMYFGSSNPGEHTVQAANLDDLITIIGASYISIENIHLSGCNQKGIKATSVKNLTINKCKIDYAGSNGLFLDSELTSSDIVINNSEFKKINGNAVEIWANNVHFTNNTIDSIGLLRGSCYGSNDGNGLYGGFNSGLIQYNKISNVAHNGIYPQGNNFTIANNYILNSVLGYMDAGAIYISHFGSKFTGQVVKNNIIINAVGNNWGTNNFNSPWSNAEGIYLDSYNDDVKVEGNTVANCNQGFRLFESQGTVLQNNTSYNNTWQYCLTNSNSKTPLHPLRFINMNNNIAFAKDARQLVLFFYTVENDLNQFGISDNNYWARPIDDTQDFNIYTPSTSSKYLTLAGWQSLSGQDANSHKSPVVIHDTADIDFYYNATLTEKIIPLVTPMIDVRGSKYSGTVTLQPYSSIILMIDPKPDSPIIPVYISSVISGSSPSVLTLNYNQALADSIPAISAFSVSVNSIEKPISSISISGTKVLITLATPVNKDDVVKATYIKPSVKPLQTASGGKAESIYNQMVTNNVSLVNTPPVIVVNYASTNFSGFVGEINASSSFDADHDSLSFQWNTPAKIPISSANNSYIKFLCPIVNVPIKVDFILTISDGKVTQSKVIEAYILPYKPNLKEASITEVEASSYLEPDIPSNLIDGKTETLWVSNGDDQWLILTMKSPFKIDHVQLAFNQEIKDETYFDILGSKDELNWDSILVKSHSCGFSGDYHIFEFPGSLSDKDYSFIKLVGHGNSSNDWNYYSEMKIIGEYNNDDVPLSESFKLTIYPNPAKDYFYIYVQKPVQATAYLTIVNFLGEIILEDKVDAEIKEYNIPCCFNNGVYLVQLISDRLICDTQKLIIQK
jgi:uncharacterized repeat protein (TIGR02059 family)